MANEPIHNSTTLLSQADTIGRDDDAIIQLVEERLTIGKRNVAGGTVKVSTRTETHEETVDFTLDHAKVDVERVPVGRPIDAAPPVKHEGDTMIVPVIEERLVVTKQLYLVEELHIHQRMVHEPVTTSVPLRRQYAVVERTDADGKPLLGTSGKAGD